MSTKYIITLRFNSDTEVASRCQVNATGKEWIAGRINIFNTYTRKSLERQTNQDFIAVLSCQEESMPYIEEVLSNYPKLPNNIIFTSQKNQVIENYISGDDKVYITALDSDDMYHPGFIQYLHDYEEKENEHLLIFNRGYIYNVLNDVIDDYKYVSPPFYTQIFDVNEYLTTYRYYKMIRHFYMQRLEHTVIDIPMYIIILHNLNSFKYYQQEYPKLFEEKQYEEKWEKVIDIFGLRNIEER